MHGGRTANAEVEALHCQAVSCSSMHHPAIAAMTQTKLGNLQHCTQWQGLASTLSLSLRGEDPAAPSSTLAFLQELAGLPHPKKIHQQHLRASGCKQSTCILRSNWWWAFFGFIYCFPFGFSPIGLPGGSAGSSGFAVLYGGSACMAAHAAESSQSHHA